MDNINLVLRLLVGGSVFGGIATLLISLFNQKGKVIINSIQQNSGICNGQMLSFCKPKEFFKMVNAGEDLCSDDIKFEFYDYCGSLDRMFCEIGGDKNETTN